MAKYSYRDKGEAMARYVRENAAHWRDRNPGGSPVVVSEAFHRGGDNKQSLQVWIDSGTWADARASTGGRLDAFCEVVAGMPPRDFLRDYASATGTESTRRPPKKANPRRIPQWQLEETWQMCGRASDDEDVSAFLSKRKIDDSEECRALSSAPKWDWLFFGDETQWHDAGFRLVAPLYDHRGEMLSIQGRHIGVPKPLDSKFKTVFPIGFEIVGLCFANAEARRWLRGEKTRPDVLHIAEGITDFLSMAPKMPGESIVGIVNGGWSSNWAERLCRGQNAVLHLDADEAGRRYEKHILHTLNGKGVNVFRGGNR